MDTPPLPDDPRDWPTDPFALLGVPQSVGEAELKRAYTRLIRKYKPEHAPEEFRRIREAYEAATEMSRWYRDAPARDGFRDLPFGPVEPPNQATSEAGETRIDPPVRPATLDPVEIAWADAAAGAWPEAYAALVALADVHSDRPDVPLRLYWLLALRPTLDAGRTRHDWLAAALGRARLSGPAAELYRRELDTDPAVALYGPYTRLLELPGVPGSHLLAVASLRLAAAAAQERWAKLELDLTALAGRANELDEALWLNYLTALAGHAAYRRPPVAAQCAALLAGLKHLELRHEYEFDRIDQQRVLADTWRAATTVPEPIRRAVAAAWAGADWREPLAAAADWTAANTFEALRKCDQVNGEGSAVLSVFARMLSDRRLAAPAEVEYPPGVIRGLVRAHLTNHARPDYWPMRPALLGFMLAERIDPDELVAACAVDNTPSVCSIASHVRTDGVLQLVCRAACANG